MATGLFQIYAPFRNHLGGKPAWKFAASQVQMVSLVYRALFTEPCLQIFAELGLLSVACSVFVVVLCVWSSVSRALFAELCFSALLVEMAQA